MEVITTISTLRNYLREARTAGKSICLVPTMGNLHAGHLKLVDEAVARADVVVTSLYVNPLQFGPQEDLDSYPQSFEEDKQRLNDHGCHCLFAPNTSELYPHGLESQTLVHVPELTKSFCGASRPGHFDGVATVVSKLFNIVEPHTAIFGLKDYQQFLVIKRMVRDLAFNIEVLGLETVRESDGLAMSSRNNYLTKEERQIASKLYAVLEQTRNRIMEGSREYQQLETEAAAMLDSAGFRTDYFAICDANNLQPAAIHTAELVILSAVLLGKTRLIDNIRFSLT